VFSVNTTDVIVSRNLETVSTYLPNIICRRSEFEDEESSKKGRIRCRTDHVVQQSGISCEFFHSKFHFIIILHLL